MRTKKIISVIALISVLTGSFVKTFANDSIPESFSFKTITKAKLNTEYLSNIVKVKGIDTPATISVIGGSLIFLTGQEGSDKIKNGGTFQVKITSSSSPFTKTSATVTIGGVSANFSVTTKSQNFIPKSFSFANIKNVDPNTSISSKEILITGLEGTSPITVSGGTFMIDGIEGTSSTITNNNKVIIKITSGTGAFITRFADITVGTGGSVKTVKFSVTTKKNTLDADFEKIKFGSITSVELDLDIASKNRIRIPNSVSTGSTLTFSGSVGFVKIYNSAGVGEWVNGVGITVNPGDYVRIKLKTGKEYNKIYETNLIINGNSGSKTLSFKVKTKTKE